jgi:uncharacterized protein (TIGR03067 family)
MDCRPVQWYMKMKRTANIVKLAFVAISLATAGCSTLHKSDSVALQGSWKGQEIAGNAERPASLVLSGANLEFHGAEADDWCKGTFSVRENTNPKQLIGVITDGPDARYVGKTVNAIYWIKDGALKITGHAPGNPAPPAGFDEPGTRQFIFKLEKP